MLHLIANSFTSMVGILTAWWSVLTTGQSNKWICNIEVATWFLMLISETTIHNKRFDEEAITILSSFWIWILMSWDLR